jgi:hypothetical protein
MQRWSNHRSFVFNKSLATALIIFTVSVAYARELRNAIGDRLPGAAAVKVVTVTFNPLWGFNPRIITTSYEKMLDVIKSASLEEDPAKWENVGTIVIQLKDEKSYGCGFMTYLVMNWRLNLMKSILYM